MTTFDGGRTILWTGWHILVRHRYSTAWLERQYRLSLPISIILFIVAVIANTLAGIYDSQRASISVTDVILSNTPALNVDYVFIYGALALAGFVAALLCIRPHTIPFVLSALALFWIIRAILVSVTHIGPYPDHALLDFQSTLLMTIFGGGQFFSGHTGAPFMLALIFWREAWLRYLFLATSIVFGVVVLLGHLHYTIDVLSAFFITYALYRMARYCFPREHLLFDLDMAQKKAA